MTDKEKQEEEVEKEGEIEIVEVSLGEPDIDEFINVLKELKENKGEISFDISDDIELLMHYQEDEEETLDESEEIKYDN